MLLFEQMGQVCADGDFDAEEIVRARGEKAYLAAQAMKHHGELAEKYGAAVRRPWLPVAADPPAPPAAIPEFEADPVHDEIIRDEESGVGVE